LIPEIDLEKLIFGHPSMYLYIEQYLVFGKVYEIFKIKEKGGNNNGKS
jgi:hypothetical protein